MHTVPVIYWSDKSVPTQLLNYRLDKNLFLYGGETPVEQDFSAFAVHGAGVANETWISKLGELQGIASKIRNEDGVVELGESIRGNLTIYVSKREVNKYWILPDPLAGNHLYTYRDNDGFAASSSLQNLIVFLDLIGKKPEKNWEFVGNLAVTGCGGYIQCSYKRVAVLPQFSYLTMSPSGPFTKKYPCHGWIFNQDIELEDLRDKIQDEVMGNIEPLKNCSQEFKIAHLTGGTDSRTVLAALLAADYAKDFSFYTSGRDDDPDFIVARRLAAHFSLTVTDNPGIAQLGAVQSLQQKLFFPLVTSNGMANKGPFHPGCLPTDSLTLAGGYNEILRSLVSYDVDSNLPISEIGSLVNGARAFDVGNKSSLLSANFQKKLLAKLSAIFDEGRELGVREDALQTYLYTACRGRWFFGPIISAVNQFTSRFDPLYSLYGLATALRTPLKQRHANVLGFGLMESLSPGISHLPFDYNRFNEDYLDLGLDATVNEFNNRGVKPTLREFPIPRGDEPLPKVSGIEYFDVLEYSDSVLEQSAKLHAPAEWVASFEVLKPRLKELLNQIPKGEFDSVFDRQNFLRLLSRQPTQRAYYRVWSDTYAILLWYLYG